MIPNGSGAGGLVRPVQYPAEAPHRHAYGIGHDDGGNDDPLEPAAGLGGCGGVGASGGGAPDLDAGLGLREPPARASLTGGGGDTADRGDTRKCSQ